MTKKRKKHKQEKRKKLGGKKEGKIEGKEAKERGGKRHRRRSCTDMYILTNNTVTHYGHWPYTSS